LFRHEGLERTDAENRLLAGYLAAISGFVNSAGFVTIGAFTSHATGNVGRLANELAMGHPLSAVSAALLLVAFFFGAFAASMAIEGGLFRRLPYTYAALLFSEAILLCIFVGSTHLFTSPHGWDLSAGVLCAAMGLQNSLVTRLSGAVVRTTHLTGVITDLGIESARWFRYWRHEISEHVRFPLAFGTAPHSKPSAKKVALHLTVVGGFVAGSMIGAATTHRFGRNALVLPIVGVIAGGIYAITNGRVSRRDRE
jgi:uncharacterized membrane protein YoaK (UPF0700 family)